MWKVFCQSVVTSILRNRNFWDSLRFPLVFLTTKACKAPTNGTHISKGHLLKISLNHTLDSALLVKGFAKIVPVFNVPALFHYNQAIYRCHLLVIFTPFLLITLSRLHLYVRACAALYNASCCLKESIQNEPSVRKKTFKCKTCTKNFSKLDHFYS